MQNAPPTPGISASRFTWFLSVYPFWVWIALAGLFGGVAGLGGFTFTYAQGFSYFSDNPQACLNCHIMREQYDGWSRSSHQAVAVCNDCHAPHDNLIHKYYIKGVNGLRHSYAFTTGDHPEPIRITPLNREVTRHACLYCHGDVTQAINYAHTDDPTDCLRCHAGVGHHK